MPCRINRAVKSCNRGAFYHFVCYYSLHTFSSSWFEQHLLFNPADRHGLLPCHRVPPAALFLQSWLLPWKASTFVLGLPDFFSSDSWLLCQGLARKSLPFLCAAKMKVTKWVWSVQHCTLFSCSFILQGTSSVEMELQVNLSDFVLAFEPQISSFLSYCLMLCLCLPATEIEQTVFVLTLSACSNHWMMMRFRSRVVPVFPFFHLVLKSSAKWLSYVPAHL